MFWGALPANFSMGAPKNAQDLSGACSGNPQAWLVFLGIYEYGPGHFRKNVLGDLEIRSKAM